MPGSEGQSRILIALTERSPVETLWQAALARLAGRESELMALFLAEDHWHRAASLPFTREISRLSGTNADFTQQRARQVQEESIEQTRRRVGELAAGANQKLTFKVLIEPDRQKIQALVSGTGDVLIAPSFIIRLPQCAEIQELDCHIELIDVSQHVTSEGTVAEK